VIANGSVQQGVHEHEDCRREQQPIDAEQPHRIEQAGGRLVGGGARLGDEPQCQHAEGKRRCRIEQEEDAETEVQQDSGRGRRHREAQVDRPELKCVRPRAIGLCDEVCHRRR
jgi:hypothetical protein